MLGHLAKQLACVNWTLRALTAPQHSAHEISLKLIEIKPFFPPLSPPPPPPNPYTVGIGSSAPAAVLLLQLANANVTTDLLCEKLLVVSRNTRPVSRRGAWLP